MAADEQTAAVQGLLRRLLPPADAAKFRLRVDGGKGGPGSSGSIASPPDPQASTCLHLSTLPLAMTPVEGIFRAI